MIFSALLLFLLGSSGMFLFRNNIIVVLMGIELMLFSVNLLFVLFSFSSDDLLGQLFSLFVLTVAAAESALGLALLVVYYRLRGVVSIDYISSLKGLRVDGVSTASTSAFQRCYFTSFWFFAWGSLVLDFDNNTYRVYTAYCFWLISSSA